MCVWWGGGAFCYDIDVEAMIGVMQADGCCFKIK